MSANVPDSAERSEQVVRGFLDAWAGGDLESIMACFAEDAVYHNLPVKPIVGSVGIRSIFEGFLQLFAQSQLEVLNLTAGPGVVLTERVDHFHMRDGRQIHLPVMGAFEVRGGLIRRFSDYFDLADWERQSGIAL